MNKTRVRAIPALLFSALLLAFGVAGSFRGFARAENLPNVSGMAQVVTADSNGAVPWSSDASVKADYSYDETTGAALKFDFKDINAAACRVTNGIVPEDTVVHKFTSTLSASLEWEWNTVIVRADQNIDDFTAFAFRRGAGHMTIFSRYKGVFYSYQDGVPYESSKGVYQLGTSALLSALPSGAEVNLTVESSSDSIRVWMDGTLIYSDELIHSIPADTGIFQLSALSTNARNQLKNLKVYTPDVKRYNNAVTQDSIAYAPLGGGGAILDLRADGASLVPGSSREGLAAVSGPAIAGRSVHKVKFSLDSPAEGILTWYNFIIRANSDYSEYLALFVRRKYSNVTMAARVDGFNVSYATDEPFESNNVSVFPRTNVLPDLKDFEKGTVLDLTIISDQEGVLVYNGASIIYRVRFDELQITGADKGLDIKKVPGYLASLPAATAMYVGRSGYLGAAYSGINCYYSGGKLEDHTTDSMLRSITYEGNPIEGFSPGSFEHDITIGKGVAVNKDALAFVKYDEAAQVSPALWSVNEKTGFTEAVIEVTSGNLKRTYRITFEVYDPPADIVEPETEERTNVLPIVLGVTGGALVLAGAGITASLIVRKRRNAK